MIRRLRDVSVEVFLDADIHYPPRIKENMQDYLCALFAPYKLSPKYVPKLLANQDNFIKLWFKHRMLITTIIIFFAGIIGSWWIYDDIGKKAAEGLITSTDVLIYTIFSGFLGCAGIWLFVIILIHSIIFIIFLLRTISKDVEDKNQTISIDFVKRSAILRKIHMNILYSYLAMVVAIPSVIIGLQSDHGYWNLFNLIFFIIGPAGFLVALFWPEIYIHKIIYTAKESFKRQTAYKLKQLEDNIYDESKTKQHAEMCSAYESLINVIDDVETIRTRPVDLTNIVKILITGIISSIPAVLQYGLIYIK